MLQVYPEVGETLIDHAAVVRAMSQELNNSLFNKRNEVNNLQLAFIEPEASLTQLKTMLTTAAHGDNAISRELQKLSADFGM